MQDPLYVKVLTISDGERTCAIIAVDLLGLDYGIVLKIRNRISESYPIATNDILVATTHTHSAPIAVTLGSSLAFEKDAAFIESLIAATLESAREAIENMSEARIFYLVAPFDWSANRHDGRFIDRDVSIVRIDAEDYSVVVFSYGCHPVYMNEKVASSDFVGYARKTIEKANTTGKNHTFTLFLNGCAGDINPTDKKGGISCDSLGKEIAQQMGTELGLVVNEAL